MGVERRRTGAPELREPVVHANVPATKEHPSGERTFAHSRRPAISRCLVGRRVPSSLARQGGIDLGNAEDQGDGRLSVVTPGVSVELLSIKAILVAGSLFRARQR